MVCHLYSLLFSFSSLSYEEMSRQKKVTWDAILA